MLPPDYLTALRVDRRRNWREMVDKSVSEFETSPDARLLDSTFQQAYTLMSSQKAREAFELHREPEAVREKYGMNRFGQSCLLARRLIEAGVRFVTVNMFETVFDEITWDIHGSKPFSPISCYRDLVGPMFDMAYSSLLEELGRARAAEQHDGGRDRRVRPHAEDQPGRRPRSLAAVLDDADGRRTAQGRHGRRRVRRDRRRAEGPAGHARRRSPRPSTAASASTSASNCPARRAGRSRWWIAASSRSGSCSHESRWLLLLAIPAFAQKLAVLPPSVELTGPEARQQLIAEATVGDHQEDWTRAAEWSSSDPKIAAVDKDGVIRPVGDGEARITARAKGLTATVTVRVKDSHAPFTWSFRNHVIPVMTKMGCNQGACHGALAGKNGFKLTLRGYDPDADYDTLTRQAVGRRVVARRPAGEPDPAEAVVRDPARRRQALRQGLARVSRHQEWIAAGAPPPSRKDAQIRGLEVFPAAAVAGSRTPSSSSWCARGTPTATPRTSPAG